MVIKCLGSSSSGNCFVMTFHDNTGYSQSLMVESGFTFGETIKRATLNGVDLTKIKTCLITHGHSDHCKSAKEFETKMGIRLYAAKETLETIKSNHLENALEIGQYKAIDTNLIVLPFGVEHDFPNSLGFVIYNSRTKETILFINDCKLVKYQLSQFSYDYVFIECNYTDEQVRAIYEPAHKRMESGNYSDEDKSIVGEYGRVVNAHMSLYGCIKTLTALDLDRTKCKAIVLMHLSGRHANPHIMKERVRQTFNIPTMIANKNGGIL